MHQRNVRQDKTILEVHQRNARQDKCILVQNQRHNIVCLAAIFVGYDVALFMPHSKMLGVALVRRLIRPED